MVKEIVLCGARWTDPDDFYSALMSSLGAPDWHGRNLDAFWDSITGGDINQVNPPFRILLTDCAELPHNCRVVVDRFVSLVADAQAEGLELEIICE